MILVILILIASTDFLIGSLIVAGGIIGGVSAGLSGGSVGDVFAGIGKGMLVGGLVGAAISLIVGGIVIGGTTVLGATMVTYGISVTANMCEVAVTQGKKSVNDGDGYWETIADKTNAMFANSGNILSGKVMLGSIPIYATRLSSKIPTIANVFLNYNLIYTFFIL